jgi:hypothetical protein
MLASVEGVVSLKINKAILRWGVSNKKINMNLGEMSATPWKRQKFIFLISGPRLLVTGCPPN